MYKITYTKEAIKDIELLKTSGLDGTARRLIEIIKKNPFEPFPPYEKLLGPLKGIYSRRINIRHRLTYVVFEETKTIRILRMWKRYEYTLNFFWVNL